MATKKGKTRHSGKAKTTASRSSTESNGRKVVAKVANKDGVNRSEGKTVIATKHDEKEGKKAVVGTGDTDTAKGYDGRKVIATKPSQGSGRKAIAVDVDELEPVKAAREILKEHGIVPLVDTPKFKKWFDEQHKITFQMIWQEITLSFEGVTSTLSVPVPEHGQVELRASIEKEVKVSGEHWDLSMKWITLKHYYEQKAMVVEIDLPKPEDLEIPIESKLALWGRYESENLLRPSERGIEGLLEILEMLFGPIRDMSQ